MRLTKSIAWVALFVSCVLLPARSRACTAFAALGKQGYVVAKSFDWRTGDGWVVQNPRGQVRAPLFPASEGQGSWTARYASLSFTTLAPGLPISGMNEAGLVIEALVDLRAEPVERPVPGRLTALELVQYGLDRFASASEFARFVERTGMVQLGAGLHLFACDRDTHCVVIETEGDAVELSHLTRKHGPQALANRPLHEDQGDSGRAWLPSWALPRPAPGSSAARYDTVASGLAEVDDTEDALALLDRVASSRTRWQLVWEPAAGRVRMRDRGQARRVVHALEIAPDLACREVPSVLAISDLGRRAFAPFAPADRGRARRAVAHQAGGGPLGQALSVRVGQWTMSLGCANVP